MPRRSPEKLDSIAEVPEEDAMTAKRGRPTKPADERRSEALNLRMTADEKAFVIAAAEDRGVAASTFVLEAVRAFCGESRPVVATPAKEPLSKQLREAADQVLSLEKQGVI